ncbi:MAG: 6-phosphogluconolactonase [Acidobacteria bacterium]|nr:6-phosphogluconolactonase [Acidobacteriota bacterium]
MELVVANLDDVRAQLCAQFERLVAEGPLSCALPGGPSALIALTALKDARVDWSRVSLFWVDERAGTPGEISANAEMARRLLGDPESRRMPRVFAMPTEVPDLEAAALSYDRVLDRELHGEPLDLAIVGVGEDGHVAGLFAGHPAIDELTRVAAVHDAPRAPQRRLTLSMSFLMSSTRIWVIAVGGRKRAIVQSIVGRSGGQTPLDILVRNAADITIFTDQAVRRD